MKKHQGRRKSSNSKVKRADAKLDHIESLLKKLDTALTDLSAKVSAAPARTEEIRPVDSREILNLPGSLQKTVLALVRLGSGPANRVAARTGRSRALESLYLNQLVQLGYVKKGRDGRTVYFSVRQHSS
jgi:predicted transcriptional regulator